MTNKGPALERHDEFSSNAAPFPGEIAALASFIAHDFGNLVTLISGHAELLSQSPELSLAARVDALAIRGAARRATHLLGRWIDFYKPRPLQAEAFALDGFLRDLVLLVRPALGSSVEILVEAIADDTVVLADREQLERALLNLVLNARDALGRSGTIVIEVQTCAYAEAEDGGVLLSVRDNGSGIPEHLQSRVFEPFFTTKGNGTGLGLPGVRQFVEQSGGTIEFHSSAGRGTVFQIRLPRALESRGALRPSLVPRDAAGHTLLLVQADPELNRLHQTSLQGAGYRVVSVTGAGEALLAAERYPGPIHAVLFDAALPWMSQLEFAERISALLPATRLVILTTNEQEISANIDCAVLKPFEFKTLRAALEPLLDGPFPESLSDTRIRVPTESTEPQLQSTPPLPRVG